MFINKIRTNIYLFDKKIYKKIQIIPNYFNNINNYYKKYNIIIHNIKNFSILKYLLSLLKKKIKNFFVNLPIFKKTN